MSLEKWVEHGWLRREPTSTGEIKDLLGIVDRSLADSKVEAASTDFRFIAALNAALCIATTALRASNVTSGSMIGVTRGFAPRLGASLAPSGGNSEFWQ
jgi:hypothetical protein